MINPEAIESIHRFTASTPDGEVYAIRTWIHSDKIPKEIEVERIHGGMQECIRTLIDKLYKFDIYVTFDRLAQGILQFDDVSAVEVMKVTGGLVTGRQGVVLYKEWP